MKHIKTFNENLNNFPTYKRGEVVVYLRRDVQLDKSTVKDIVKRFGCDLIDKIYDNGFIIKTEDGKEEFSGSEIVENYPEFFDSYERLDLKDKYVDDNLDDISDDIELLRDLVGSLDKFGKSKLPKDWNDRIDSIIMKLDKIKIR
jgi:hypothetical protein